MNDQVLTDDEKDALLEGVESGEVEIQSSDGPKYANVEVYEVPARNRLKTNSFPRLQSINGKLAGAVANSASMLLNEKVEVEAGALSASSWGEFCETSVEPALLFEFSARPLENTAVIRVQADCVRHLVETFYGGSKDNPPRHDAEGFTPGEANVVALLCREILKDIVATWQSLIALDAAQAGLHASTDIVEVIENGSSVLASEFTLHLGGDRHDFHIVWPTSMLAPVLPVLEGAKRERDSEQDGRWEQVLRSRVPEALVGISSCIGSARMTLREVAALEPGDIIDLQNPRKGTVFAKDVAVLEGRFGVHDGCYAIEATRWLAAPDPVTG